jgi:transcriptional regulator with XRE-family HTH domain
MSDDPILERQAADLARNVRMLREGRGLSQTHVARLAGVPRATWSNLESGAANPTLSVLTRVAAALRVSVEELLAPPRARCRLFRAPELRQRTRGTVVVRDLLPDPLPGLQLERLLLPEGGRMTGTPHTPGTREYLTCERGVLSLTVEGHTFSLEAGDVLVFRGDQKHGYANTGTGEAVGYSVVVVDPRGL